MSFDILSYTACKEITYACTTGYDNIVCTVSSKLTCLTANNAHEVWRWICHTSDNLGYPDNSNIQCTVGSVCGTTGTSTIWTVPVGVKKAKFELWGPGGPGGTSNCCGSGAPGSSGSYMQFTMPVTPGCQYTVFAAVSNPHCPYCCGCSNYYTAGCYCSIESTYVTGYGLSGVCARGGYLDYVQNMCARLCRIGCLNPTPTRFINEYYYTTSPNSCGITICNCVSLCNCGSQLTYHMHPVADWNFWPCGSITVGLCSYTPILRIPSIHSGQNMDSSNYGMWYIMPPIVPIGGLHNTGAACCLTSIYPPFMQQYVTSGSCAACFMNYDIVCGCIPNPGLPGMGTHTMAGTTGYYGSRGRPGAVKITWAGTANTTYACSS